MDPNQRSAIMRNSNDYFKFNDPLKARTRQHKFPENCLPASRDASLYTTNIHFGGNIGRGRNFTAQVCVGSYHFLRLRMTGNRRGKSAQVSRRTNNSEQIGAGGCKQPLERKISLKRRFSLAGARSSDPLQRELWDPSNLSSTFLSSPIWFIVLFLSFCSLILIILLFSFHYFVVPLSLFCCFIVVVSSFPSFSIVHQTFTY